MKLLVVPFISMTFTGGGAKTIRGRGRKEQQREQQQRSYSKSVEITSNLDCSGAELLPLINSNPHFTNALSALGDNASSSIDALCADMEHGRSLQEADVIPFSHVTGLGRQHDKTFFDGGTSWNHGLGDLSKEQDSGRILAVSNTLESQPLQWPSHIVNFDDVESCELRTVTCCWTNARDGASGDVVNISAASSSGTGTTPQPNSDVCMVHMDHSPQAAHVKNGKSFYSDGRSVDEETNDAYCVGFSYSDDPTDISHQYRANALFQIAMLEGFYTNDLVGGVPGAPMCGCVEQMPIVSHSACRQVVATRRLSVDSHDRILIETPIEVTTCDQDDLVQNYASLDENNDVASLSEYITGSCPNTLDTYLGSQGMKRGDAWWFADSEHWTPIVGKGDLYHPEISLDDLMAAYATSSTRTIRRICKSCAPSHRDIYYTRTEETLPDDMNLLELLKDKFSSNDNILGVDFSMYSKDSKDGTITNWTFCNYSSLHGFPFECGPTEDVEKQWTSFTYTGTYARDFAFYIEK